MRERHERASRQRVGGVALQPAERGIDLHEPAPIPGSRRDQRNSDRRLLERDAELRLSSIQLHRRAFRGATRKLRLAIQAGILDRARGPLG
jgi:hypothetical protein